MNSSDAIIMLKMLHREDRSSRRIKRKCNFAFRQRLGCRNR